MSEEFIGCTIKELPADLLLVGAAAAISIQPANAPAWTHGLDLEPAHLASLTGKYWGAKGIQLGVSFPFDTTPADLQRRIVEHMNAWSKYCNVSFVLTTSVDAQVRITRAGQGYWSYLGTDILSIPRNQPTLCLQGFTMRTPESEFVRVVRHEAGHTLSFPHEHMRGELIQRLDRARTIAYFRETQGWDQRTTIQQVLTPLSESSLMGTPNADQDSILCYQLPGSITIDGQPIRGGTDITATDAAFAAKLYPPIEAPKPPPVVSAGIASLVGLDSEGYEVARYLLKGK